MSYEILGDASGSRDYERVVVEGYGHLDVWMGQHAERDVFPMVRRRVDCVCRGSAGRFGRG